MLRRLLIVLVAASALAYVATQAVAQNASTMAVVNLVDMKVPADQANVYADIANRMINVMHARTTIFSQISTNPPMQETVDTEGHLTFVEAAGTMTH
jgi:hypothetical protein